MTPHRNPLPRTLAAFACAHARGGSASPVTNAEFAEHLMAIRPAVATAIHSWLEEEASLCNLDPEGIAKAEDRAAIAATLCARVQGLRLAGHKALTHVRIHLFFDSGLVLASMDCCIAGSSYRITEALNEDGTIDDGPGCEELALPENADALKAADQCGIHLHVAMAEHVALRLSRSPKLRQAIRRVMSVPPELEE